MAAIAENLLIGEAVGATFFISAAANVKILIADEKKIKN